MEHLQTQHFVRKIQKSWKLSQKNIQTFFNIFQKKKELDFNLIETDELKNKDKRGDIFLNTTDLKNFYKLAIY